MSYSQFTSVKVTTAPGGITLPAGSVPVEVIGPLGLDKAQQYVMPITIVFSLIQNRKNEHDPEKAYRVGGVVQITDPNADKWSAVIGLDPKQFYEGDARGVGTAVLEQVRQFGIETITWCDNVKLPKLK